ncbi:SusC/RagA family TonB-linked outer membrane protein [Prevotella sp.]|uniref:SusC/RagA family TonB-linked outer membrane protein n=1 Tax=Prevotella sp. TaxID=59823 RepID=UPI002F920D5E
MKDKSVVATAAPAQSREQATTVSGKVVDVAGEPLIGATILEKGTSNGVITDLDGHFSIKVPVGTTLVVSYVGFNAKELRAAHNMVVTLSGDAKALDEVVVVGYGTQKKANLTGSVSQVKMDEVLGDRPVVNAAAALQGAMPGLTIGGGSGPGFAKSLNVRGTLSINGGSPLVLIDNVEGDISALNPEDIESVTVLKDAASSAIYGARAAGGVILVTLKHPKSNDRFTANYNFNLGWEKSLNRLEQASLMEYLDAYLEAGYSNSYWAGNGDVAKWRDYLGQYQQNPSSVNTVGDGILKDEDGRVYWLSEKNLAKNILSTGSINNHNLTVSGGSERIRYRLSGSLSRENGPLVTNKDMFRRKTISGFISADVLKWFTQEASLIYTNSTRTSPQNVGNMSGFYTTRLINYYPEGNIPGSVLGVAEDLPSQTPLNMLNYAPVAHNESSVPRVLLRSIFKPLPNWTITGEYTYNRTDEHYNFYSGRFRFADVQLAAKNSMEKGQDFYRMSESTEKYNALNVFSNYEHTWGNHAFKAMVGYNQEKYYYRYFYGNVLAQAVPSVPSFAGGTGEKTIKDSYSEYTIRSGFARLNYAFADRYLLEVNGRYDGSSKFPKDHRFGFFPSVSVGWRMGQEAFMDWAKSWLDDFKLRLSYGSVGNQRIAPYQFTPTMSVNSSGTYILDGGGKTTYITSPGLVSSNFTWEKVTTFNVGFDLYAFKNRLTATFDWYKRKTTGMLSAGIEIPGVVGTEAPLQNVADMKNNGWELNLTWRDRIGDFSYRVGLNIYDSQAEITKFNNESGLLNDYYVGRKIGEIWGYVSDGYYSISDFDAEAAKTGVWKLNEGVTKINGTNPQPGDVKFKDLDGDNVITVGESTVKKPGDRKVIGNDASRYQFGASLGASYKGFSLDVMLQGVGKRDYWLSGAALFPFGGAGAGDAVFQALYYNQTDYWVAKSYDPESPDYMVPVNSDSKLFRIYGQGNNVGSNTRVSDKYLQNAAYLRVKNVTLSYTFPKEWTRKVLMQDAKVYVSIENLATFSKLPKGYDPEGSSASSTANALSNGISWGYPYYRTVSVGASITF